jgi:hypothetical protein
MAFMPPFFSPILMQRYAALLRIPEKKMEQHDNTSANIPVLLNAFSMY